MTAKTASRPMTALQAQVLGCIRECGPADAVEVERNLLVAASVARGVLARLERRGYVSPQYTGHQHCGRAYVITAAGEDAYQTEYADVTMSCPRCGATATLANGDADFWADTHECGEGRRV